MCGSGMNNFWTTCSPSLSQHTSSLFRSSAGCVPSGPLRARRVRGQCASKHVKAYIKGLGRKVSRGCRLVDARWSSRKVDLSRKQTFARKKRKKKKVEGEFPAIFEGFESNLCCILCCCFLCTSAFIIIFWGTQRREPTKKMFQFGCFVISSETQLYLEKRQCINQSHGTSLFWPRHACFSA